MKITIFQNRTLPLPIFLLWGLLLGLPVAAFPQGGVIIENNAHFVVSGTARIVVVDGKWQNDGVFDAGMSLVSLQGSLANATVGGQSTDDFYDLTIDKSASAAQLASDITVSHQLALTAGALDLNTHALTLGRSTTGAVTRTAGYFLSEQPDNSSAVAWVIGTAPGVHTIPFGTVSGGYIPVQIEVTSGNLGTVKVSTYPTNSANLPYPVWPTAVTNLLDDQGLDNSANTVDRFWEITPTGAGVAKLTLTAQQSELGTVSNLTAQRWDSVSETWEDPLPGQTSSATAVTVPNVSAFSTFAITENLAPLQVQFLDFEAYAVDAIVLLKWKTGSEVNSDHFSVQRSADGLSFTEIGTVGAAGNSQVVLHYADEDRNPLQGRSFYRIVEHGTDGSMVYSEIRAVYFNAPKAIAFEAYPNPTTQANLRLRIVGGDDETITVTLTDLLGRVMHTAQVTPDSDIFVYVFENLPPLVRGTYIVQTKSQQGSDSFKIMVE
jgi:hypothetical protein